MKGINSYWKQLTGKDIARGRHREVIGGMWDEIGRLQFEFLKSRGLQPQHTLLDVGCGALRGGIHFVGYLNEGNYCGLDVNESLIKGGHAELATAKLTAKKPQLLVDDQFRFGKFGMKFDYALAVSVFSHLPMNHIAHCLLEMKSALKPDGQFLATFFQAPRVIHIEPITHDPGGVTTYYDRDAFHYAVEELTALAEWAGMTAEFIGDWQHPRSQNMMCFWRKA